MTFVTRRRLLAGLLLGAVLLSGCAPASDPADSASSGSSAAAEIAENPDPEDSAPEAPDDGDSQEASGPAALSYDFSQPSGGGTVPDEVSGEIDVLKAAQDWSLFLTQDLAFSRIRDYLIPGSYQYEVAWKYATGEDITFTSAHTLLDPAFTGNTVTNFTWITGDCFSVDISFVKHMRLRTGKLVDDPMNDRFYFVRYDDTADDVDNPTWKLVSMKEILNHAEE